MSSLVCSAVVITVAEGLREFSPDAGPVRLRASTMEAGVRWSAGPSGTELPAAMVRRPPAEAPVAATSLTVGPTR